MSEEEDKRQRKLDLMEAKHWREIEDNEIVIEIDSGNTKEEMDKAIKKLVENEYNIKVYKAEGQRSPHCHIIIEGLEQLNKEDRQLYREAFLRKYCPSGDMALAQDKHCIACEEETHYKYGTIKKLIFNSKKNKWHWNYVEPELMLEINDVKKDPKRKKRNRVDIKNLSLSNFKDSYSYKVAQKIKITELAEQYGLSLEGNKVVCPFHADRNPSLNLDDATGIFHCFGCHASGGIIKFEKMLIEKGLKKINSN